MEEIEMKRSEKSNGIDPKDLQHIVGELKEVYGMLEKNQDPNTKHFAYNIAAVYNIMAEHIKGGKRYRKEQLKYLKRALEGYQPAEIMYEQIISEMNAIK